MSKNESVRFSENANLAIRRTAHQLLLANGNSSSAIPPVQQPDANTFVVELESIFEYGKLPQLLQKSLELQGITRNYNVSILACENERTIVLGYSYLDLQKEGGVPCASRSRQAGCYRLRVTFEAEQQVATSGASWWFIPFGCITALLGFILWQRKKKEHLMNTSPAAAEMIGKKVDFGNSEFDLPNLELISSHKSHQLTYREAKLLNLFLNHTNQVLEREFILKSVWEDEGVVVGRSLDVFVSRLRKMLAGDTHVKIAAVHGVGYRMEVNS